MSKNLKIEADQNKDLLLERVPADQDLNELAREAAFMEEPVTIHVHSSTNESDPPHFILNVNGVNQPVVRGKPVTIKRKYLEVLARMKETKYSQPHMDLMNPLASNAVIPRTAQVYPFEIVEDRNPKGRAWCAAIMAEPA